MSTGPVPRLPREDGPVLFLPEVDAPHLSDLQVTCDMWSARARQRREHALELEAVAQLAHRRRGAALATADGRGGPGVDARALADPLLEDVREDFVAELALSRDCSEAEAAALLRRALLLTGPLTPVWSALYAGRVGDRHVAAAVDLLGDATPEVAARVQARVLPRVEGLTAAAFRDRLRYHLDRVDAEARERRRREALTRIGVHARRVEDGVGELVLQGPTPAVFAAWHAVDGYARLLRADGDQRPIGVLRADTALDLLLRPWDTSRPPVTAHLVVHASARALRGDGDPVQTQDPAEVDGQAVSAAECRELLRELGMIGVGAPPAGGSALVAVDQPGSGETVAVATPAELRRGAGFRRRRGRRRRGGPARLTGSPAAEPAEERTAFRPGLRLPPDTLAYRPTAAQQRLVTVRDRHCRMPGCRRRVGRCQLDHARPYDSGGPTACWNLCCLCTRHHRIKTHARDWSFTLDRDGRLLVTTPAGITRTTRPPGWCTDPEPDPPWLDEQVPPDVPRQ